MKKICSLFLAIVMIAATFAAISIPVAAVDGDWAVYTLKSQDLDGYNGIMHNVAGYEYTDEGFSIIPPDEEDAQYGTPYVTAQTKDKVDIKNDGVYMKVRVDDFTYGGDIWFSFHVWTDMNIEPGKQGPDYGYGIETLIKTKSGSNYDPEDTSTYPGALYSLHWYSDPAEGERNDHGSQMATATSADDKNNNDKYIFQDDFNKFDEEGRPIFILEIKWREDSSALGNPDGIPEMYINGAKAPDALNLKMADIYKSQDYKAYVGFSLQNSNLGGAGAFTILEFGTYEGDATTPLGDDSQEPIIKAVKWADTQSADSVPVGNPAITLNGDSDQSDSKGKPSAYNGNKLVVNEKGFVTLNGNEDGHATISLSVKDDISYAAEDFPVMLLVFKNLCTCPSKFDYVTEDLKIDCQCEEKFTVFPHVGNSPKDDTRCKLVTLQNETAGDAFIGSGKDNQDNTYLYVMADLKDLEGRIHGFRLDVDGLVIDEPGRKTFDLCMAAFFRNTDEAQAYAKAYIEAMAEVEFKDPNGGEENTTTPSEEETTTSSEEVKPEEKPAETTTAKAETKTEKNTEAKTEEQNVNVNVGCGSTVGFGALAVICLAGAGLISFRKKED